MSRFHSTHRLPYLSGGGPSRRPAASHRLRIGQPYEVRVKRFLMQHTVEDRILHLQSKKMAMVQGALGGRDEKDNARQMRVEDLKFMFS